MHEVVIGLKQNVGRFEQQDTALESFNETQFPKKSIPDVDEMLQSKFLQTSPAAHWFGSHANTGFRIRPMRFILTSIASSIQDFIFILENNYEFLMFS